ncbi:MAG: hypothetical protein ACREQN_11855 [Candidatus Binataceae bacterium]
MAQYIEVEQAIGMRGLRLVLTAGVPGPWGEAAKGIFHVKKIPFVSVRQEGRGSNLALLNWTKQTSAPVAIYNDERPRSTWIEQLYLAERLAADPPLIPAPIDERVLMFGLCNEICGETGFGWSRRLMMLHETLVNPDLPADVKTGTAQFGARYGYAAAAAEAAPSRCAEILKLLAERLAGQRARGSRFFIGDRLSALDIHWAAFAALVEPLPDSLCAMSPRFRQVYTCAHPAIRSAITPQLLEQRDFIYHEYLELPIDL